VSALPAGDREPAGARPAAEWAQITPAAPQLAATMRRYLGQLATFLAPRSVEVADSVLRQLAHWLLAATSVTAVAAISRDDTGGLQAVAGGPARRGGRPALGQHLPATAADPAHVLRVGSSRQDWPDAPPRNPGIGGDIPPGPTLCPSSPGDQDAATLMAAARAAADPRDRLVVELLARTGMRTS
jgi:hypothetical protein